jgi:hypothetical protein
MVEKPVGSVLVEFEDKANGPVLLVVTEKNGNIYINNVRLPVTYNVEESIRWILSIPISIYIIVTYFKTEPDKILFRRSGFLKSWWEDYASAKVIVTATVLISKMDYDSAGYDSVS